MIEPDFDFAVFPVFEPLEREDCTYFGAHGGRGSGKTHYFGDRVVNDCLDIRGTAAACIREVQRTLGQSSKRLIESKIRSRGLEGAAGFKIFKDVIEAPGDGIISFIGMQDHTADSIKSLEDYRIFWWDEAQNASAYSLKILRPTMRHQYSRFYASWNPKHAPDPEHPDASIDGLFRLGDPALLPGGGICVEANYTDNCYLPMQTRLERRYDHAHRIPEDYQHIWLGKYQTRSEARVFHNWSVQDYVTPANAEFLFGGDFGFSVDPTVLLRMFVGRFDPNGTPVADSNARHLFIDCESYAVGCDIDYTPALWAGEAVAGIDNAWGNKNPLNYRGIEGADRWVITADSSNPQAISYLQRHGLPRVKASIKGKGSIEEGVEFLKAYTIIIHPRCKHAIDEFTFYSYKTDPKTERVLPVLDDKKNHVIDSARYAVEDKRRAKGWFDM